MKLNSIVFLFLISTLKLIAQTTYHPPLLIPLTLAANFGELRPNHFHMGVDFRTNGVEGLPLYAIENGYVARVKISPNGYGKVIYVNHPNQITSVYAHCSKFVGSLDSLIQQKQQEAQNFEIEFYLNEGELPLKKGTHFAFSGNSGSSTGPHLHFELRNTITEAALNPLKFGFDIKDTKAPQITALKIVALTKKGYQIPNKSLIFPLKKASKGTVFQGTTFEIPSNFCSIDGGQALSFEVNDFIDGSTHTCGIYESHLSSLGDTLFQQRMDSIYFDHSRFVNSHKDYDEYLKTKRKFNKAYKVAHNPLTIYPINQIGILTLQPGDSIQLNYTANDVKNNAISMNFTLKAKKGERNNLAAFYAPSTHFIPDSSYTFKGDEYSISIPAFTFYEPVKKLVVTSYPNLILGNQKDPIQLPISLSLKPITSNVAIEKQYIKVNNSYIKTTLNVSNWLTGETKNLGKINIGIDTLAPAIVALNFKTTDTLLTKKIVTWRITESQTEIIDYDLFIDNVWHVLEYEKKGNYLIALLPTLSDEPHSIEIIARDACQNTGTWKWRGWLSKPPIKEESPTKID
jgi:hypothetical protein